MTGPGIWCLSLIGCQPEALADGLSAFVCRQLPSNTNFNNGYYGGSRYALGPRQNFVPN